MKFSLWLIKHYTMKTEWRVEVGMAPHILNLGTRWRRVVTFTFLTSLLPVPTGQETGWVPEPVWTLLRRETFCPCPESNTASSVVSS
jgi:hypothetical protein